MKRALSLWLGLAAAALLAVVLAPAQAPQAPAGNTGKIHGKVINPTGQPQGGGTVSLSTDGGVTLKFTFPVDDIRRLHRRGAAGNLHGGLPRGRLRPAARWSIPSAASKSSPGRTLSRTSTCRARNTSTR